VAGLHPTANGELQKQSQLALENIEDFLKSPQILPRSDPASPSSDRNQTVSRVIIIDSKMQHLA
jgi:hypothetical protein